MSDVAISNIAGPGPAVSPGTAATEPFIMWQGQPFSRESAATKRTELMSDPAYVAAASNGDTAKQQELAALFQISRSGTAPQPPQTFSDVQAQMDDRASRERASHAQFLRNTTGFNDEQVHEVVNGRPIPLEEKRYHEQQVELLKRDRAFIQKYLGGDRDAVLKMKTHVIAASLPVGTQADIDAWKAAYPFKRAG